MSKDIIHDSGYSIEESDDERTLNVFLEEMDTGEDAFSLENVKNRIFVDMLGEEFLKLRYLNESLDS